MNPLQDAARRPRRLGRTRRSRRALQQYAVRIPRGYGTQRIHRLPADPRAQLLFVDHESASRRCKKAEAPRPHAAVMAVRRAPQRYAVRIPYRAVRYATDSLCSTACLQTLGRNCFSLIMNPLQDAARRPRQLGRTRRSLMAVRRAGAATVRGTHTVPRGTVRNGFTLQHRLPADPRAQLFSLIKGS